MFDFILANIAMFSAGAVLYLLANSLPRIGETEPESRGILERWVASELPEKLDGIFNTFAGKFLRKLKVIILKLDNAVSRLLKRFKNGDGNGKSLDFKEMMGDKEIGENNSEGKGKKKK